MVRSKQTSEKTTGGPAKRGELPKFKTFTAHGGTKLIKTVRTNSKAVDAVLIPPHRAKVVLPKPLTHNIYCFFCWDGGTLYDCFNCPRAVCRKCVIVPAEHQERIDDEDVRFICPGCHEMRGKGRAEMRGKGRAEMRGKDPQKDSNPLPMTPYFGFEDNQGASVLPIPAIVHGCVEVTSRSQVCSDPILILHFVLETLSPSGSPAHLMPLMLEPYRPKINIRFHEIIFDLGTPEKIDNHIKFMEDLVGRLKPTEYERVEIFIYTHSETTRGDIWGGYEDGKASGRRSRTQNRGAPVAYTVNDFFEGLFVGGIQDYLKGATLWMLVCGHMVREPDSFKAFKDCINQYDVEHAFAFGAPLFHACLISPFVSTYLDRVLVEGFEVQEVIQDLLQACPRLATHSSIIHLHRPDAFRRRNPTLLEYHRGLQVPAFATTMVVSTYSFFNENNRPFGKPLPYQCSSCMCIRPWQRISNPSVPDQSKFTCQICDYTITFMRPEGSKIILFSKGHLGTSGVSGKLVKKGHNTVGSGWLMSTTTEPND